MDLTHQERQQFQNALLSAYNSKEALQQFAQYHLDQRLDNIVRRGPLHQIVLDLINWTVTNDDPMRLLRGALEENPNNNTLRAFARQKGFDPDHPAREPKIGKPPQNVFGILRFQCIFNSDALGNLELPVEVRRTDAVLVARTLTSKSVRLVAGSYYAVARLPAGQELYGRIDLPAATNATVILTLDPNDVSSHETHETSLYLQTLHRVDGSSVAGQLQGDASPGNMLARFRLFEGGHNQDDPYRVVSPDGKWSKLSTLAPAFADIRIADDSVTLVQLIQPFEQTINVRLPGQPCKIRCMWEPDGRWAFSVYLDQPTSDLFLGYYEQGQWEEVAALATSKQIDKAEELLSDKVRDPIGATIGAYALLRFNQLERLHDWTANLFNRFPRLADGAVIRAEHLARLGRHKEALDTLLTLANRGLPVFTDGLTYVVDRLQYYVKVESGRFAGAQLPEAEQVLRWLQMVVVFADLRRAFVTFTGLDPNTPDATPADGQLPQTDVIDLAQLV